MSPKSDIDSNLPYSISVFLSHLYFFQISQHLLNMVCMGLCFLTKYPFLMSCSWLWETMVNPTSLLPSPHLPAPRPFSLGFWSQTLWLKPASGTGLPGKWGGTQVPCVVSMSSSGEAAAFDDEWRRETSRFRQQRPLEFRRHEASGGGGRRAEGPPRLAIQGPEDSPSRQSRRYDW